MSIPPRRLPKITWRRILREVRTRTAPSQPRAISVGSSIRVIAEELRDRQYPRFFGLIPEQAMLLARFFPEAEEVAIYEADQIRMHKFDILGSGETSLGANIDWHSDFKNGYQWPVEHYTRLELTSPDGGMDVKVPWELSRFHHAIRLGQAYLYTQNEVYAEEVVAQISDWIDQNPYEFGVNWAGPMDVAIRVVNWIWAYYFIIESKALTTDFLALWLTSIQEHGDYLIRHLEDGWPRTNHLIANLTGLAYLGIMFPEFNDAARWREIGLGRLWEELERQVYPDGVNYEASTAYHAMVLEFGLSVSALCIVNGIELPETGKANLRAMLDVLMATTRPDGLLPHIGDADDGSLVPLSVYADPVRQIRDRRRLFGLGSLVLERMMNEWAGFVEPSERGWSVAADGQWQDAFWYFASDAAARLTDVLTRTTRRPAKTGDEEWVDVKPGVRVRARALTHKPISVDDVALSRGFEAGGLYVMRHEDFHLTFDAGTVGQDGAGGHAHNDVLSLTLSAYGKSFLIDPGSYVYTSDPIARNAFRSTAYHNTLQVNGEEINYLPEDQLFSMSDDAMISVHRWISQREYDFVDASHNGYLRLNPGIIHRRQIWFDKVARLWVLNDTLTADPYSEDGLDYSNVEQEIDLRFHFAPMPIYIDKNNNAIRSEDKDGGANLIILPLQNFPLTADITEGWYAPRYGIKEKTWVANFTGRVKLPIDLTLLLYPHQTRADFRIVQAAGQAALSNFKRATGAG